LETSQKPKMKVFVAILVITAVAGLLIGGWLGYFISSSTSSERIDAIQNELTALQQQVQTLQIVNNVTYQNITYVLGENVSLSRLYGESKIPSLLYER